MSIDFQILYPQGVVDLNGVRVLEGFTPRTLDILGDDFRDIDEVVINDVASPDVVVLSQTRLLAQVPRGFENTQISSVTVVSNQLTLTEKSLLRFRIGRVPGAVSGILRLLQVFVKVMFTTPGKDIFTPALGGGALKAIGSTFASSKSRQVTSEIVISANTTQRQILAIQARDPSLPRDERLLSARVLNSEYNPNLSSLNIAIQIVSHAGQSATANILL